MENCIFCKIIEKKIPSKVIYEDEQILAFHDIDPKAPVHALIIPKVHIISLNDINEESAALIAHLTKLIPTIAKGLDVKESGYRVVVNCGKDGGQEVAHLHYHLLGGRKLVWPPG